MRKLHCCIFLKTRPRGEALRDDTRNHKHTHLVLLPIKTQRVMLPKQPRPKTPSTGAVIGSISTVSRVRSLILPEDEMSVGSFSRTAAGNRA